MLTPIKPEIGGIKSISTIVSCIGFLLWGYWDDLKAGYRATPNNRMTGAKNSKRTPQEALMAFLDSPGTEDEITTYGKVMTAVNAWAIGKQTFTFKGNRTLDTQPILASKFAPHENCMPTDEEGVEETLSRFEVVFRKK